MRRNSIFDVRIGGAQDVKRRPRAQRQVDREEHQRQEQRRPRDGGEVREEVADRVEERREGVSEGREQHAFYLGTRSGRMNTRGQRGEHAGAQEPERGIDVVERQPHQRRGRVAGESERRDHRRPTRPVVRHGLDRERVDPGPDERRAEPGREPQRAERRRPSARPRATRPAPSRPRCPRTPPAPARSGRPSSRPPARARSRPRRSPASSTPRVTDPSPNSSAASTATRKPTPVTPA